MLIAAAPLPGYQEPYGLLCAILQDGTNAWRWELDQDLSEDAVVWQPSPWSAARGGGSVSAANSGGGLRSCPGRHSIGAVILHIAAVEVFWFERFALGQPPDSEERKLLMADETDVDEWSWHVPPRRPISWYFEMHDRIRARTLESIKKWPPADTAIERDGEPRTMRWVLGHVIQHEAYHLGQAVLLNRLWHLRESGEQG